MKTVKEELKPWQMHLENAVETLARLPENNDLFLSVYFRIDKLKNNLQVIIQKILQAQISLGKKKQKEVFTLIEKLEEVCKNYQSKHEYSLAVFIRNGEEPFHVVVEIPGTFNNEVYISKLPSIFSLAEKKDIYHRYAVVLLTSVSARIVQVNAGRITKFLLSGSLDLRSKLSREISRERYMNHQEERGMKFYKEKITIIENIIRDNELDHIILAGEKRFTAQFRSLLPEHLVNKVIDETLPANIQSFESILKNSIETFIKQEEKESTQMMNRIRDSLATGGLAIAGYENVRSALRDYRLDTLVISKSCPKTLADEILREAVVQKLHIETVEDDDLQNLYEGFAGFVRYKIY